MIVTCDSCRMDFNSVPTEQTKTIDGIQIVFTFVECPHCNKVYPVCFDNAVTNRMKQRIKQKSQQLKQCKTEEEYQTIYKNIQKRKKTLLKEMNELQRKYETQFIKKEN